MGKLTEKTYEEEVTEEIARRAAQAEARGRQEGELQALRAILRILMEDRFGPLPQKWLERIERASNGDVLKAAILRGWRLDKLDDLEL